MKELIYSSRKDDRFVDVLDNTIDEASERLIGKIMARKVRRYEMKGSKYFYTPSEEYKEYAAKHQRRYKRK